MRGSVSTEARRRRRRRRRHSRGRGPPPSALGRRDPERRSSTRGIAPPRRRPCEECGGSRRCRTARSGQVRRASYGHPSAAVPAFGPRTGKGRRVGARQAPQDSVPRRSPEPDPAGRGAGAHGRSIRHGVPWTTLPRPCGLAGAGGAPQVGNRGTAGHYACPLWRLDRPHADMDAARQNSIHSDGARDHMHHPAHSYSLTRIAMAAAASTDSSMYRPYLTASIQV